MEAQKKLARLEHINGMEMVGRLLRQRSNGRTRFSPSDICSTPHLDEDSLSAFVEGRLRDAELKPLVGHLVECGSCRRASAELLQLKAGFDFDEAPQTEALREPGRLRRFLEELTARVLTTDENAVMAYHAESDEPAEPPHGPDEKPKENQENGNGK
jgi:hypothetical protein